MMPRPDFERNILQVLKKKKPERVTLFELFLNDSFYQRLAGRDYTGEDPLEMLRLKVDAFCAAGYDYASTQGSGFGFTQNEKARAQTVSLNHNATITDWESFEAYVWQDPLRFDTSILKDIAPYLPDGMKLMLMGPGGVLENTIALTGYDNLCLMLYDEPSLVAEITARVGSALLAYYESVVQYDTVGFLCANDDWGFNTQTMLSPADMRRYIFPWHRRIVALAHQYSKPCILHSCGNFDEIIEDVIVDMQFDGRHSYEDKICPVEEAYDRLAGRIAVLGGIDMDFMTRQTPEAIFSRAIAMLDKTRDHGGYCLGTGNSVPESIPFENYAALLRAAREYGGI